MINNSWIYYAYGRERVAELEGSNGIVYYNYDHLGSVRVVYEPTSNCSGSAVIYKLDNMSDYYAFGKTLRTFGGDKHGYQGSEKNKELGDNDYYTHFRGLDVEIGRWKGVDPVYQPGVSPYISMDNNPVSNIDPLGDCVPCLEAAAVVGEIATAYREAKGTRTLLSILKGVKTSSSPMGEITLDGRDLTDPFVLDAKKNSPDLYSAYLLSRYHSDTYATTEQAYEAIMAAKNTKAKVDEMAAKKGPKDLVGEAKEQQAKQQKSQERQEKREKRKCK